MLWTAPAEKDTAAATLERRLWDSADQFRANSGLKAQEYSGPILGLIFLCFAEVRFTALHAKLEKAGISGRRCLAQYTAEEARIVSNAERTANANPPGSDVKAQQKLMASTSEALKAAAERAEQCERDSRKSTGTSPSQNQCAERATQQINELNKRYAGRSNLSLGEQTARREEQDRIIDSRMACERKAR
jgi:hypothetical protein